MKYSQKVLCRFLITEKGTVTGREVWGEKNMLAKQVAHFLEILPEFGPGRSQSEYRKIEVWIVFVFTKRIKYPYTNDPSFIPIFPDGTKNLDSLILREDSRNKFFGDIIRRDAIGQ